MAQKVSEYNPRLVFQRLGTSSHGPIKSLNGASV
ncbi:hypothetical protein OROHE_015763 [Orobanche hederae]